MEFQLCSKIGVPSYSSLLLRFPPMNKRNQVLFPPAIVANDKLTVAIKRPLCKLQATAAPSSLAPEVQLPPGPKQFPLVGNIPHLLIDELPHRALRNLARIHGPVMLLRLGEVNLVVISSREGAEEVLRVQDVNFANRPELTAAKIICYDCKDVLFSSYSRYWQQLRRVCIMELLSGKRVRSYSALRVEEVTNLVHEVSIAAAHGKPVNLSKRLSALSNNIVCRASFGQKCSNPSRVITLVDEIATLISGFNAGDFFPSLKFLDVITGARPKLERIRQEMDRIFDESIEAHQLSHNEGEVQDLIDVLLHLKDQGDLEIPITTETIKAIILDMFGAGTETSATVMIWMMSELMRNPEAMQKVQKEVRETMKGRIMVEESQESELSYFKSVVKETLRLYTPGPLLLPRECKETCQVLGYKIPAGTRVVVNAWALGRDPQYWEDAESFKPERFNNNTVDYKGQDFEFIPFGAGRRICPGISFGTATVELALTHLLYYFDWKLPNGMKPHDLDMTARFGASLGRKSDLWLIPIPRYPSPYV